MSAVEPMRDGFGANGVDLDTLASEVSGDAARREDIIAAQRARARRIGAGVAVALTRAEKMDLDQMLGRFAYLTATNEVVDLQQPWLAMSLEHFRAYTAASVHEARNAKGEPTWKPAAAYWLASRGRLEIATRTWLPGAGPFTHDPHGRAAVNLWTPRTEPEVPHDWCNRVQLLLDHLAYLVPDMAERERFLDWLAHIEQRPGEPVHGHYLMIAGAQGTGRNWLASVLARVWPGNVALSASLQSVLRPGGFNAELSQRLLGVVDELHEGAHGRQWALAEQLKSLLTQEQRRIRPKYGREHDEFNRMRWLMFSNHLLALPIGEDDRRFWVIENPARPKPVEYYERLYAPLNAEDDGFIAAVRHWLGVRDLSRFKPNEHPLPNAIKAQMADAIKSEEDRRVEELRETWPADVIPQFELQLKVFEAASSELQGGANRSRVLRAILARVGGGSYPDAVKLGGKMQRIAILRNRNRWFSAKPREVVAEAMRAPEVATRARQGGTGTQRRRY